MARRRLNVRRIDPWSVLKFGAVANLALLLIGLLVVGIIFYFVDRLGLIDQVCSIVLDVGFEACGVNAGNLFRAIALLGVLGVVILTAVLVFLAFLHNLIADLTGGLTLSVFDDTPTAAARSATTGSGAAAAGSSGASSGAPMTARRPPEDGAERARGGTPNPPVPPLGEGRGAASGGRERTDAATRRDDDLFRRG